MTPLHAATGGGMVRSVEALLSRPGVWRVVCEPCYCEQHDPPS